QEIEELERDMAGAKKALGERFPELPSTPPLEPSVAPPEPSAGAEPPKVTKHHWKKDSKRKLGLSAGDTVLTYRAGDVRSGFGLEHMVSDRLSLFINGGWLSAKLDENGDQRPSDRLLPAPAVDRTRGFLVDAGLNLHWFTRKHWNAYTSLGVSNVNYTIDDGERLRGGSVYGRLGAGVRWIWSHFHLGLDVGWYPYELTRYVDNGPDADGEVIDLEDSERVDSNRVLGTWYVGWRF
ncbi:MAG: hypothetical protein AAF658_21410, partial [Myxococcota bacterium]